MSEVAAVAGTRVLPGAAIRVSSGLWMTLVW